MITQTKKNLLIKIILTNINKFFEIRSISSENKGFKMLSKLGWSEGQSLGKNNDGLLEPVSESFKQSFMNG